MVEVKKIKKILIANRGEIAVRIIRACKELGISTVAICSEVEKHALHALNADKAICVGPANVNESYMNALNILEAAKQTGADAIHPGYGLLSENATFAYACQKLELIFIGPEPEIIKIMGEKNLARALMQKHKVPILPGLEDVVDYQKIKRFVGQHGAGITKANSGGGGKGIRILTKEDIKQKGMLEKIIQAANDELIHCGSSPGMYIEKYLSNPKHIEVQILADNYGNVIALGERDCSIQRRHQKLIEESPARISDKIRQEMCKTAIKIGKLTGYIGAGTVEFLYNTSNGKEEFYFMEMNTRLQVEHPVTEMVTGIDIVKAQILIAEGKELSQIKDVNDYMRRKDKIRGHAIELRILAEDYENKFRPNSGEITALKWPSGDNVRVDTYIRQGTIVLPHYDSLLAKIIVHGENRWDAVMNLFVALAQTNIRGIKTTFDFYKDKVMLVPNFFKEGNYDTSFIGGLLEEIEQSRAK